jgi:hypothetical protein
VNPYRVAPTPPPRPDPDETRRRWLNRELTFAEHFEVCLEAARWDERWAGVGHVSRVTFTRTV